MRPPARVLGKPVVAWYRTARHTTPGRYDIFYVIVQDGHLYDIHRVKKAPHARTAYWVAKGRTWEQAKEKFEQCMSGMGIVLPTDFFRDKSRHWRV